jgi:hypothetical protein
MSAHLFTHGTLEDDPNNCQGSTDSPTKILTLQLRLMFKTNNHVQTYSVSAAATIATILVVCARN